MKIELHSDLENNASSYLSRDFRLVPDTAPVKAPDMAPAMAGAAAPTAASINNFEIQPAIEDRELLRLKALPVAKEKEVARLKRQQENPYYLCFQAIRTPLLLVRPGTMKIIDANLSASRLLGLWISRLRDESFRALVRREDRPKLDGFIISLLSLKPASIALTLSLPSGSIVKVALTGSAINDGSEAIGCLLQLTPAEEGAPSR